MKDNYVKVNDNYRFNVDGDNYCLQRSYVKQNKRGRNGDKTGDIGWKTVGYYTKLSYLYDSLLEQDVKSNIMNKFESIIEHMETTKKEIHSSLNNKIRNRWINNV